jgi:hypothetical protein
MTRRILADDYFSFLSEIAALKAEERQMRTIRIKIGPDTAEPQDVTVIAFVPHPNPEAAVLVTSIVDLGDLIAVRLYQLADVVDLSDSTAGPQRQKAENVDTDLTYQAIDPQNYCGVLERLISDDEPSSTLRVSIDYADMTDSAIKVIEQTHRMFKVRTDDGQELIIHVSDLYNMKLEQRYFRKIFRMNGLGQVFR